MPFNPDGSFSRILHGHDTWATDAAAGTKILSSRHDQNDNDLADGLSNCITKTGNTQPTANIPMAGFKITNLGTPTAPSDAATKGYVDNSPGWTAARYISGADLQGRLNFTSLSGVNGITWSNADMSWFGKAATANQTSNRLVVNSSIDGTSVQPGTDLVSIDETGNVNLSSGVLSNNLSYDGTNWRTPVAGSGSLLSLSGGGITLQANDTATTTAYQTATLRSHSAFVDSGSGSTVWQMLKSASGKTNVIYGCTGGAGGVRWIMQLGNATAESGSNAGSDFEIDRYNDAGASLGTALSINRASGAVTCSSTVSATGYQCKSGTAGPYSGNNFNIAFGSPNAYLFIDATNLGIISVSCDYRIKKDIAPLTSTWDKVKALRPISYTQADYGELFKANDTPQWGFIAHELQETLLPSAASGEKDAPDVIQGPNLLAIVAALTSALQEAMLRIEALEARP